MAKIKSNDKKRTNGNFVPQGKNGGKKKVKPPTGHVNKYAGFSKADRAVAIHETAKLADVARREREERERNNRSRWGRRF